MSDIENKVQKIIEKSGHDFHSKVSKELIDSGWDVIDNHYYNDPDSGKSREIDIIAQKYYTVPNGVFNDGQEKITIKLFIECKYINSLTVFWFRQRDIDKAIELSKDNEILNDKADNYVNDGTKHHYVRSDQVTGQWQSENSDIFAEAQHQVLKAMLFFEENSDRDIYEISYPILVVNDLSYLFKRDVSPKNHSEINENFQIETNYSYKNNKKENITKYFLIDVVPLPMLEKFIEELELKDIRLLKDCLAYDLRQQESEIGARYSDETELDPYD
jgi:hypothetical protein